MGNVFQNNPLVLDFSFVTLKGGSTYVDHEGMQVWQPAVYFGSRKVGVFFTDFASGAANIDYTSMAARNEVLDWDSKVTKAVRAEATKLVNAGKTDFGRYYEYIYEPIRALATGNSIDLMDVMVDLLFASVLERYGAVRKTLPKGQTSLLFIGTHDMAAYMINNLTVDKVAEQILDGTIGIDLTAYAAGTTVLIESQQGTIVIYTRQ